MSLSKLSRRDVLRLGALGAGSVMVPLVRLGLSRADSGPSSPPVPLFSQELLPQSRLEPDGTTQVVTPQGESALADTYHLTFDTGMAQMLPEDRFKPTQIWGFNGQFPGPLFRIKPRPVEYRARPVVITETNLLTEAKTRARELDVSTHLHGGNVDGFNDGHPEIRAEPAPSPYQTKVYTYFNDQPAVTMWYHDHANHHTSRNVYMGIAGFYLVSDVFDKDLQDKGILPIDDFDVPLLIQGKFFNADGSLNFPPGDHPETAPGEGTLGDTIVVNGKAWPYLKVQRRKYRFRFLNGSAGREFLLRLSTGQPFLQIATEGGLLPKPVEQPTIRIAQAERYEVIVDFAKYPATVTEVVLENALEEGNLGKIMRFDLVGPVVLNDVVISKDTELLQVSNPPVGYDWSTPTGLRLLDELRQRRDRLETLRAEEPRVPPEHRQTLRFDRSGGGFAINGQHFCLGRDDITPREAMTQVLTFENSSGGWFHPVHLHLLHAPHGFLLLERNGVKITPADQEWGWKETINVGRNNTVKLIMEWPKVPVNPRNSFFAAPDQGLGGRPAPGTTYKFYERRYVFHCHNTDHEDFDMMSQMRIGGIDPPVMENPPPCDG